MRRSGQRENESRSAIWIAALLSLLANYLLLTLIGALIEMDIPRPQERIEISLAEEPEPEPEPKPEPEPEPEPKPKPEPKPEKQRPRRPQPRQPPAPEPPAGAPEATPPAEPVPESPEPAPPVPEKLDLEMDWNDFEKALGEVAVRDREEWHRKTQEKRRGTLGFGTLTGRVREALNNHHSWVAAGSQEELGKRQIPFRNYIERVHDNIHSLFADSFLASLSSLDPSHPLNDFSLMAKLEFEVLRSGRLNSVHVIRSSGNTVFDAAAVDAVTRAAPYPPPPTTILSWNDRVYFRWGFYRNRRKCGVFNSEPYILRAPNAAPEAVDPDELIVDDG